MLYTEDEIDKMGPPVEEREKKETFEEDEEAEKKETFEEDEEAENVEVQDDASDKEEGDDGKQQDELSNEEKEEVIPQVADKTVENTKASTQPKDKKSSDDLNLNNEVVRMRKEVKRVRALIIRKLTRQFGALKKKKGKETEIERNQRRAARLLEEIHALKGLSPDLVTKTALQKNLNFEQECKNPKSTISDRAIARIATHPQFNKKIADIKAAVQAFKEERTKGGKQARKETVYNKAEKVIPQSLDKGEKKSAKAEDISTLKKKISNNEEGDGVIKDATDAASIKPGKAKEKATNSADVVGQSKTISEPKNVKPTHVSSSKVNDFVENKPQTKVLKPASEVHQKKKEVEESDLESSDDEEKERFDDSTEERFHKQSSQSEESDSDNNFFIGKVSKYKKKKKPRSAEKHEVKEDQTDNVRSKLDEFESRMKSKMTSLQSVFCSLSSSKPGAGRGAARGRGGDGFRGRGKARGGSDPSRDFGKRFTKMDRGAEKNYVSKSETTEKGHPSFDRSRGRGRGDFSRQKDRMGRGTFSRQDTEPALHPSWEASKKRKEQQGQILAFQGKRIKFDDDD